MDATPERNATLKAGLEALLRAKELEKVSTHEWRNYFDIILLNSKGYVWLCVYTYFIEKCETAVDSNQYQKEIRSIATSTSGD